MRRLPSIRGLLAGAVLGVSLTLAPWSGAQASESLTVDEVKQVIAQAVQEAQARGVFASIAVSDRVGNILGLYEMQEPGVVLRFMSVTSDITNAGGAIGKPNINQVDPAGNAVDLGIDGLFVPSVTGAIAKAITGAYLSSGGNAFTTRTASQIIQEHFNPGEFFAPSGPLFGVQFSQLPCSDLSQRSTSVTIGPKRSPLGLSGDPGGLPLYKNGQVVGGIGVMSDGIYSIDLRITDVDNSNDELIAVAGTFGFTPPSDILGNRITVEGKTFRYTDRSFESLVSSPPAAPSFDSLSSSVGGLVPLPTYFDGTIIAGQTFGDVGSGIIQDTSGRFDPTPGFVLVDETGANRYPSIDGTEGTSDALTSNEVTIILKNALQVATRARAQIRRPLNSHAQVTISVVDTNGAILGVVRTPDGPLFGTDVSLQKARTAAFISSRTAGDQLVAGGQSEYVNNARAFIGPTALADGVAFADRSGGNLSRPLYPDGIDNTPPGPFSRPISEFTPFATGLQLDLVIGNLASHVVFLCQSAGITCPPLVTSVDSTVTPTDTEASCTSVPTSPSTSRSPLANGMQIFPGSVPIYRGDALIGGIGISGDGVDQDDMIAFLGLHNAGVELGTGVGNAPLAIRADNLVPQGARLRYVNCPFTPFIDSNQQNACAGK